MRCCICREWIARKDGWDEGNNAKPVREGRCCDYCNRNVVIPARLQCLMDEDGGLTVATDE
jgi:hypothetical protein